MDELDRAPGGSHRLLAPFPRDVRQEGAPVRLLGTRPRAPQGKPTPDNDPSSALATPFGLPVPQAVGLIVVAALMFTLAWVSIAARLADQADPWGGGPPVGTTDDPDGLALGGPSPTASTEPADAWFPGSPGWDEAFGSVPTPAPSPTLTPTVTRTSIPVPAQPTAIRRPPSGPTSTPAPDPTPRPVPKPQSGPAVISVPSSIDSTGARDAGAALNAFIGKVKDGSTIVFRAGGVYRLSGAIKLAGRHGLTLNGNGATLRSHGPATEAGSLFWLTSSGGGDTGITIENFRLVGDNPSPGFFHQGRDGAAGVIVEGGRDIDIHHLTVSAVWGDCLKVKAWASNVTFHDSDCVSAGRNGVSIVAGRYVTVQRVAFRRSGYTVFAIRPTTASQGALSIKFLGNTAGTWTNAFFTANGAPGSRVNGVLVSGNRITGGTMLTNVTTARRKNIVFTNNMSTVKGHGPILRFAHVDGLTVRANHQPLSSGSLARISDCSRVQRL